MMLMVYFQFTDIASLFGIYEACSPYSRSLPHNSCLWTAVDVNCITRIPSTMFVVIAVRVCPLLTDDYCFNVVLVLSG